MTNIFLLGVDPAAIDWARAQFALTAIYHWLFVPLTLGLGLIMAIMESCYLRFKSPSWLQLTKFWQRLFGINFAMGVATGIILEFEFGTNWSNYSWFVGDIFGAPLAIEAIVAFFLETTFVAVMFFGWNKVSPRFHLASTWLTCIGATLSAWWILVANAWMQNPVGCDFNPDTMRNEMISFFQVALSPFALNKFFHTVTSSWIVGAVFVSAVSSFYLLKGRHSSFSLKSLRISLIVGIVGVLLAMQSGDGSAYQVAKKQPMKLAAMEGLYDGHYSQSFTAFALVNPFRQPDYANSELHPLKIEIPYMLSMLATRSTDGFVPGINDILSGGYVSPDGIIEPSVDEKIQRGRLAITALKEYRELKNKRDADSKRISQLSTIIQDNMQFFGYGFVKDKAQLVPYIPIPFYAFRIMVALSMLFLLYFIVTLFLSFRHKLSSPKFKWLYIAALCLLPLAYICSECGWLVAELGRQPWAIQDMLPTWVGISNIGAGSIMLTFFLFLILFSILLAVEISIMVKAIAKGPDEEGSPTEPQRNI